MNSSRRRRLRRLTTLAWVAAVVLVGCGESDLEPRPTPTATPAPTPDPDTCPPLPATERFASAPPVGSSPPFPAGFRWGAAAGAFQTEGGNIHSDWWAWEQVPGRVTDGTRSDDGPNHWTYYLEDLDHMAELGLDTFRFGLEWARVFPTREQFDALTPDAAAVEHYHAVIAAMRARGIEPMLTLHHFTNPRWWVDPDAPIEERRAMGFAHPDAPAVFARWAAWAAEEFGDEVDRWLTINEPFVLVQAAHLIAVQPPWVGYDTEATARAWLNLIRSHATAYDAIRAGDRHDVDGDGVAAETSFVEAARVYFAGDPCDAADRAAAARYHYLNNELMLNAVVHGDLDANFDGDLDDPGDLRADPGLRGRADFVGFSYYTFNLVRDAPLELFGGVPGGAGPEYELVRDDMGRSVYPDGLHRAATDAGRYGLPVWVIENGMADGQDNRRPRALIEHLHAVARAIAEGVDVRGYLHWSLTDNFEWNRGLCPRFGLVGIDYDDPLRRRISRTSGTVLAEIARTNMVPADLIGRYPEYGPATACP